MALLRDDVMRVRGRVIYLCYRTACPCIAPGIGENTPNRVYGLAQRIPLLMGQLIRGPHGGGSPGGSGGGELLSESVNSGD